MEIFNTSPQAENPEEKASAILVKSNKISRRELMKLSLEERRCILAQQAETMLLHYQQNRGWQELEAGDTIY
jgi:hypothetical protein